MNAWSAGTRRRNRPLLLLFVALAVLWADVAAAQSRRAARPGTRGANAQSGPQDFRSRNFLVHTDLPADEARELLKRLETMLGIISRYWGQPNRKTIEIYVVKDLSTWPEGFFPPQALASLQGNAGITLSVARVNARTGRPVAAAATAYAVADHGTPLHEAVHAYCHLNFGSVGPTWYSEGMAEMGNYWREDDSSVLLPEVVLQYLQESEAKPLLAIVDNTDQTGDSWQNYAWRWALCHMLANNPNYAPRFRPLGLNLLLGKDDSFEQTYGSMAEEIEFEYHFFLEHLDNGVQTDLIAWDWKAIFRQPSSNRSVAATIVADRGWQPSRLRVEAGREYQIEATGTWKTAKDADEHSADGDDDGRGKLVGIVLDPTTRTLGEEFDLGAELTFTAPSAGNLYLRCRDDWSSLSDNEGKISTRISYAK